MTSPLRPPSRRDILALGAGLAAGLHVGVRPCSAMDPIPKTPVFEDESLDKELAELTDQRDRFEPIAVKERAARVRRLGRLLDENRLDAILIEPGTTLEYLTELRWGLSERLRAAPGNFLSGSHRF